MQKHMVNCEKVGHEDKANLYHHLRSLPALPHDIKEEGDDDNSLAMSSFQSSSVVLSFSSSITLNKLQTGIQRHMSNNYCTKQGQGIIIFHLD